MADPTSDHASPIAEISHGPTAFERFLDRNQKLMILLALLIAVGAGAWVVISGMNEGKRLAAGEALVSASDIAAMQDVVKNHPDTPATASGSVLLSDMQWDEGQQTAAIETLRAEIAANPEHPATVAARARLATRLLQQGEVDAAQGAFRELVDRPDSAYLAPYALLSLSEIARNQGKLDEAKELLEQASEDHPDNPLRNLVVQAIDFVDFQMPAEIDPPAPDPIEPAGPSEPDLSTPVELDPTNPGTGTGNPLLDNLTGDAEPGGDAGESPQDAPVDGAGEPSGEGAEESTPAGE